jgi:hypothetical protein
LDLFGKGFTLLDLSGNGADMSAFSAAASKVAMPIEVIALNDPAVRQTYERPLVLVRPDGHVAWRGDFVPANASEIVDYVRGAK